MSNCEHCGKCCRLCHLIDELKHLDSGDGSCIHLTSDNKCAIFETRPDACNGDKIYARDWSHISKEDYCKACEVFHKIIKENVK